MITQCLLVRFHTDLNVGRSDMADHSPAQLRRKTPGMEVTVLSTLWSAGE